MNRVALTTIAPEIYRKRLLVEGYFRCEVTHDAVSAYFERITRELGLRTYGGPIIHRTSGEGTTANEGDDSFLPLIDSGIYIAAWINPRFLSTVIYTCADFRRGSRGRRGAQPLRACPVRSGDLPNNTATHGSRCERRSVRQR